MRKISVIAMVKFCLWSLIIVPGLFVAGLIDYSANHGFFLQLLSHFHFIFFSVAISVIATLILTFFDHDLDIIDFLLQTVICCIIISYIAVLSSGMAYFVRSYGFYNLIILIIIFIGINLLNALLTS